VAGSVNKVILVGNLGTDPEAKSFSNGGEVVNFSLATSESWNDKQSGEKREKTEWHKVAIFNENLGRIAKQYLKKGSKVYLEGKLQTRKWQGQDGQDRYTTEIVLQRFQGELTLLGGREGGGGGSEGGSSGGWGGERSGGGRSSGVGQSSGGGSGGSSGGGGFGGGQDYAADLDDDVPF